MNILFLQIECNENECLKYFTSVSLDATQSLDVRTIACKICASTINKSKRGTYYSTAGYRVKVNTKVVDRKQTKKVQFS